MSFIERIDLIEERVSILAKSETDQSLWGATQIEAELLDFRNLLLLENRATGQGSSELRHNFNILYSRLSQAEDPGLRSSLEANGQQAAYMEIVRIRDAMAAIIDAKETYLQSDYEELDHMVVLGIEIWRPAIRTVLAANREYLGDLRQQSLELLQRIKATLYVSALVVGAIPLLLALIYYVRRAYWRARTTALVDDLTGCGTRDALNETVVKKFSKLDHGFSVAVVDVDNLKNVNDSFGHQAGDFLIRSVGEALRKVTRGIDFSARVGGDEFIVLLDASKEQAQLILSRASEHLENARDYKSFHDMPMEISFGVAYCDDVSDFDDALEIADQRMYVQKSAKRISQ